MYVNRQLTDAIDACFHELWQPPGMAVGLCTSDGLVWSRCLGQRQLGSGPAIDEHTSFALCSATKTLAVASIAHLCGQAGLSWDTRVADLAPDFDAGNDVVTSQLTLRDLACHRTGWTSSEGRHRGAARTRADLIQRLRYHGFRHPFREAFAYCTDGFSLLGHIVDRVSGDSWERYAQTNLLEPLGMRRTHFSVVATQAADNFAQPHVRVRGSQRVAIPWRYEDGVATPAGGANSCLADVARWLRAWLANTTTRTPWPQLHTALLQTPQVADSGAFADKEFSCAIPVGADGISDEAYALGWYCHRYRGERVLHHTGSIRGFRSLIALLPERALGFIALVNSDSVFLPRALLQATLDSLQGSTPTRWTQQFLDLEHRWHESNADRYRLLPMPDSRVGDERALAGKYRDDGRYGTVAIVVTDTGLAFEAGNLQYRLSRTDADTYTCAEACGPVWLDHGPLQFRRGADGSAAAFTFQEAMFRTAS